MYQYLTEVALCLCLVLIVKQYVEILLRWIIPRRDCSSSKSREAERPCRIAAKKGPRISDEKKVSFGGAHGEPFVDLFFKVECSRSPKYTTVFLVLNQTDWGIKASSTTQCYCGSCTSSFIDSIAIQVIPKSWASKDCFNLLLQPPTSSGNFVKQKCSNINFLLSRPPSISYQVGNNISINSQTFGWNPASRPNAKSILWSWKVSHYADASKLKSSRICLGSMPPLGFDPRHMQYSPGSFEATASWNLAIDQDIEKLEFDVYLCLSTIFFQKGRLWYSVEKRPEFLLGGAFDVVFEERQDNSPRDRAEG